MKQYYLQELKEAGILKVQWKNGEDMTSDVFTKNQTGPLFEKYGSKFYGKDKYNMESLLQKNKNNENKKTEISFMAFEAHAHLRFSVAQRISIILARDD